MWLMSLEWQPVGFNYIRAPAAHWRGWLGGGGGERGRTCRFNIKSTARHKTKRWAEVKESSALIIQGAQDVWRKMCRPPPLISLWGIV